MKKTFQFLPLLICFLAPFLIYLYTLCPTISVQADAAELSAVVLTRGIAHPPGYPLFTLLTIPFSFLPFGEPAWRINLASAFFGSLTCFFVYFFLERLTKDKLASLSGALIFAFSKFFWRSALVSEVFTLNTLLAVLLLLIFQIWREKKKKIYLFLFLFLCGLGLVHHQTIVFLYPLFLIWFLLERGWKNFKLADYFLAIFVFLAGLLPYLYVVFAAKTSPFLNWENPQNIVALGRFFTRATYGSLSISATDVAKTLLSVRLYGLIKLFLSSFSFGFLVAILGIIYGKKQKGWLIFSLSAFSISGPLFILYTGLNTASPDFLFIVERFFILPTLFLAILAGFGLAFLSDLIKPKKINFLFLVLPLGMLALNFNHLNQNNNFFGRYLAEDLFKTIPQESILLIEGDAKIGAVFYYQKVLGQREDVKIIVADFLMATADWYRQQVKKDFPDIYIPENWQSRQQFMDDFILVNSQRYPVISAMRLLRQNIGVKTMAETVGLTENYLIKPEKINAIEAEKKIDNTLAQYQNILNKKDYPLGTAETVLLGEYAYPYTRLANEYFRHGLFNEAERLYLKVLKIAPNNYYTYADLGDIYATLGQKERAIEYWQKFVEASPYYYRAEEIREKIEKMKEGSI